MIGLLLAMLFLCGESATEEATTTDASLPINHVSPFNRSIFLEAWAQAVKAITTGEPIPFGHWLAFEVLDTLTMECQDPILRKLTFEARKKTPEKMIVRAGFIAHVERHSLTRLQFNREKEMIRKSQPSWEWFNWKICKQALEENQTELLEHAQWTAQNQKLFANSTYKRKSYFSMEGVPQIYWKASRWRRANVSELVDYKLVHQPIKRTSEEEEAPETATPRPVPNNTIRAFDCSHMKEGDWGHWHYGTDCLYPLNITSYNTSMEYLLLQEITAPQLVLGRCQLRRTKVPLYCGYGNYPAIFTTDLRINQPVAIPSHKCWELQSTQRYVTKTIKSPTLYERRTFKLAMAAVNQIEYDALGQSYLSTPTGDCWGGPWWSPTQKQQYEDVTEWRRDKIQLERQPAYLDQYGRIRFFQEPFKLPNHCEHQDGYCVTRHGTWVWSINTEWDECRMIPLRWLQGTDVSLQYRSLFSSLFLTEDLQEYYWKTGTTLKCGREVLVTQHQDIYLRPRDLFSPFPMRGRTPLQKQAREPPTWNITVPMGNSTDPQLLQEILTAACEKEVRGNQQLQSILGPSFDPHLTMERLLHFGNGTYFLQRGPWWKRMQCHPQLVQSRTPPYCTQHLPVTIFNDQPLRIINNTSSSHLGIRRDLPLYLEPYTYRLSNQPKQVSCKERRNYSWTTTTEGQITLQFPLNPQPHLSPPTTIWDSVKQWENLPDDMRRDLFKIWFIPPMLKRAINRWHPDLLWWKSPFLYLGGISACILWCFLLRMRAVLHNRMRRPNIETTEEQPPPPLVVATQTLQHPSPSIQIIVRPPDTRAALKSPPSTSTSTFSPESSPTPNDDQGEPIYDVPRSLFSPSTVTDINSRLSSTRSSSPDAELRQWLHQLPSPKPWVSPVLKRSIADPNELLPKLNEEA